MTGKGLLASLFVATMSLTALAPGHAWAKDGDPWKMDRRSYDLGVIAAFAEMVDDNSKTLAFSAVLPRAEASAILQEATRIAKESHVAVYREPDLIVTDLFPADVAKGKDVLLIYKGATLDAYLALKRKKAELVKSGAYTGKAREEIARQLGRLLSYSEATIDTVMKKNTMRE